jgi:protein CpxP
MKKSLAFGLALAATFTVLTGFRGCGHRPSHDPAQMAAHVTARLDSTLDDLEATPAQRQQIQAIKDRLLASAQTLHATRQADRAAALAEWDAASPDRAKIHALVDQRADALRAMAHQAVDAIADAHDVLTPEQRAKVSKKLHRFADQ